MTIHIFRDRLAQYDCPTLEAEENALKEMLQETILFALSNSNFFNHAIFHGGTALRIHHQMPRFSEDLDFLLDAPNPDFSWKPYSEAIVDTCREFGIVLEIKDRKRIPNTLVHPLFIKDVSIGQLLTLSFHRDPRKKLIIKLEIDTNPPSGTGSDYLYIDFPVACSIRVQDLASGFALKNHALLCRSYVKGRDWYDFHWYIKRRIPINFELLKNALHQQGPWAGRIDDDFDGTRFTELLSEKILEIDWPRVKKDVAPFLSTIEQKSLTLWDSRFFLAQLDILKQYLGHAQSCTTL